MVRGVGEGQYLGVGGGARDRKRPDSETVRCRAVQSGRPDSNRGPSAPKADALPGCATPRHMSSIGYVNTLRALVSPGWSCGGLRPPRSSRGSACGSVLDLLAARLEPGTFGSQSRRADGAVNPGAFQGCSTPRLPGVIGSDWAIEPKRKYRNSGGVRRLGLNGGPRMELALLGYDFLHSLQVQRPRSVWNE